ncbi:helix-turn-helix transcriptional regulator [Natronoarchaeum mannanilyticum]
MRVRAALLTVPLLFALLVAPAAGTAFLPAGAADGPSAQSAAPTLQSDGANESDVRQVFRINLTADGDARWTVTTRIHDLDTEDDRQAFRDLAAEYEAGETDAGYSAATFEPFAANASESTGREMTIRNESRSTRLDNGTGYLSFSFTWTNFARVDGDRVALGDAFLTPSGTWLSDLEAGQRLMITAPNGYAYESWNFGTSPDGGVKGGTATWTGPATFEPGGIEATYVATGGSEEPPGSPGEQPSDSPFDGLALLGVGLVAIVGGLALGGYVLRERDDAASRIAAAIPGVGDDPATGEDESLTARLTSSGEPAADEAASGDREAGTTTDADGASTDDDEAASSDGADGEAAGVAGAAANASDADDGAADSGDEIDPELLSDEERVERLLRENGGRMKQASIVTETGWSNAKVSQLLSSMDEEGRVDKLRIGRENLISLPDEDVTEVE